MKKAARLSVGKQPAQTANVFGIYREFIRIISGHLGGFFTPQMAAHSLSPHHLTGTGDVNPGFGALMGFKLWHLLNLRPVSRLAQFLA